MTQLGTIIAYGGPIDDPSVPEGWLLCKGSAISRVAYAALYKVIGDTFGEGDGSTTFNIPDLQGQFLRGVDAGAGRDVDAAWPPTSGPPLGPARRAMKPGGPTGDAVGTVQDGVHLVHDHAMPLATPVDGVPFFGPAWATHPPAGSGGAGDTDAAGGSEDRPVNAALAFLIRVR